MKTKVLIVEDDIDLGNLLSRYLTLNGFFSHRVYNGREAREELSHNTYSIVIIDVMMPVEDGFSFAAYLSEKHPEMPFLFVTARKLKEDVLFGLRLGADDYIVKPFDVDELILRVRNILKRNIPLDRAGGTIIQLGNSQFDPENLTLVVGSAEKILTEKEAGLLKYLYDHRDQLIKRTDILSALWQEQDFFSGRSLDVFITRIRKLLADDTTVSIESIRGVGFRLRIFKD